MCGKCHGLVLGVGSSWGWMSRRCNCLCWGPVIAVILSLLVEMVQWSWGESGVESCSHTLLNGGDSWCSVV